MLGTNTKYLLFLLWVGLVYFTAIAIFTSGFLLRRQVLTNRTDCLGRGCNQPPAIFKKAVILIVDALKYDFCLYNSSLSSPLHHQNKLPILSNLARPDPISGLSHGALFKFVADPPTTTMQRLKGLTTGGLPTFLDISSNFGSYEVTEDNMVDQLVRNNRRVVFAGDDTWTSLYPDSFTRSFPQPSFDVWDLDTVDRVVEEVITKELRNHLSWDVLIGHTLGVDHAGHKFGPNHPQMSRKLSEVNVLVEKVARALPQDTLLLVMGDHGMTWDGDHGGDSPGELNAGLFVYSPQLGMERVAEKEVAQIDLVPTVSLLLGVPIPFSNLGSIIEELFLPTALLKDHTGHSALQSHFYSSDNLINFRLPYIKTNVHQVYRYLTAYLAAGGSFPDAANSRIRSLATRVINRPGALSTRQVAELYNSCLSFLREARDMCQSVWVEFNLPAMGHGLNLMFLHTSVLLLLVLRPQNRLLSHLVSGPHLFSLAVATMFGVFLGFSVCLPTTCPSLQLIVPGSAVFCSVLVQGLGLLWKLRQSLVDIVHDLVRALCLHSGFVSIIFLASLVLAFSNSFVVLGAQSLNFLFVSMVSALLLQYRHSPSPVLPFIASLSTLGLVRLSSLYVRCREEQGPNCPQTDFHKPLSTLPADLADQYPSYKNWRYFFSILSLFLSCLSLHYLLSRGGNLNGVSIPVLTARYFPWLLSLLISSYWALQAFPTALISALLPWQQNLFAHLVYGLVLLGLLVLAVSPRLVYLVPKRERLNQVNMVPRQENVATYFNYIKANWKTTLGERSLSSPLIPMAYGLGTSLSAPLLACVGLVALLSMLLAGDGQCPAILLHLLVLGLVLLLTSPLRLSQATSTSCLLVVPTSSVLLWFLADCLSFYTTGHQPTFPHLQWPAAFVGFAGTEFGGPSTVLGWLVPGILVTWNTYSATILSGLALPLLLLSPLALWFLFPVVRRVGQGQGQGREGGGMESNILTGEVLEEDLAKGEAILLNRVEEGRGAMLTLASQYLILRAAKLFSCILSAAVLRRHLMVWKIFAPHFIFEAVGFCISFISVLLGFLFFNRILSYMSKWYMMIQKV